MLLTVMVPTIGRPQYFGHTLDSIRNQTEHGFEVLVSDNASMPPVADAEVSARLAGIPYRLVRRSSRMGFSAHFNQCVQEATGEWVMFISDDDLIAPDYLAAFLAVISTLPKDVSMIVSHQHVIDEKCLIPEALASASGVVRRQGLEFVRECQAGLFPDFKTVVSMCARRETILGNGGFPDYPHGAHVDNMVWMRLAKQGDTLYLPVAFHYRIYGASVGLSMPLAGLLAASEQFERELTELFSGIEDGAGISARWRKGNTNLMLARWRRNFRSTEIRTWQLYLFFRLLVRRIVG